jgi:hypothetical protein
MMDPQTSTPPAEQAAAQPDANHDDPHKWGRVRVEATPAVLATLRACAACASAPADVRAAAAAALSEREADPAAPPPQPPGIPWRLVQRACECAGGDDGGTARHIRDLLSSPSPSSSSAPSPAPTTARLLLPTPPPPKPRPPELVARLQRLKEMLEDQRYAAALKDASPAEAAEVLRQMRRRNKSDGKDDDDDDDDDAPALLPSTRLQLSFGLQVVVTMGAFFALGYYGGKAATGGSVTGGALLGTVGLVAALLLETALFVVRSSPRLRELDKKYGHLMVKKQKSGGGVVGRAEEEGEGAAAGAAGAAGAAPTTIPPKPSSSSLLRQRRRPA